MKLTRWPRYASPGFVRNVVVVTFSFWCLPPFSWAQAQQAQKSEDARAWECFHRVEEYWRTARLDSAAVELTGLISDGKFSDQYVRRAYLRLIYTYQQMADEWRSNNAASEVLEKFPDISVREEPEVPLELVGNLLRDIRANNYGRLLVRGPEGAGVWLDGTLLGTAPCGPSFMMIGPHELVVSKKGYYGIRYGIEIRPDTDHEIVVVMAKRSRPLWQEAVIVAGAVGVAFLLAGGPK